MEMYEDYAEEFVEEIQVGTREKKRRGRWVSYKHDTGDHGMPLEEFVELEREQRVKDCGKPYWHFDLASGSWKFNVIKCRQYRLCDNCLKDRAETYRAQALTAGAHNHGKLYVSKGEPGGENIEEIKEAGKKDFLSFPMADGSLVVLHKEAVAGAERVTVEQLRDMDWKGLANTPEDKRITGHLGRSAVVVDDAPTTLVEFDMVTVNAPIPMQIRCKDEAMHKVGLLDPQTIDEAVEANNKLVRIYMNLLLEYGFSAKLQGTKRKIKSIIPNWDVYRFYFLKGCAKDPVFQADKYPKGE